jgi:hypothetical protein
MSNPKILRAEFAELWHSILNSDPKSLFGPDAALLRHHKEDDWIAQPGYVGKKYKRGGLLFVGMNPGGTTIGEVSKDDQKQLALLTALRESSQRNRLAAFEELTSELSRSMKRWAIYQAVERILESLDMSFSEVAYINLVKWRTKEERVSSRLLRKSWYAHAAPQIKLLQPGGTISLGVTTAKQLDRLRPFHLAIERTIGDKYWSPKTENSIRKACRYLRAWKRRETDYLRS